MASVTHEVTTPDTGNTPNTSGAFSPASGDLLVVFVTKEASTSMASADLTSSVAPTGFTLIRTQAFQSGTGVFGVFVANALTTNTTSRTVSIASGADPGAGSIISVLSVSGLTRVGADAVRQEGGQDEQAGSSTPSAALSVGAALTANPLVAATANSDAAPAVTQPSGWTEHADSGYTTGQDTTLEVASINSGFTGSTVTWVSSEVNWTTLALELDTSAPATPADLPLQAASAAFSATLALTAPALLPLQAASAVSSASLAVVSTNGIYNRHFDEASAHNIEVGIGGANQTGAYTLAALVRRSTDSGTPSAFAVSNITSASVNALALGINTSKQVIVVQGFTARNSTTTVEVSDGWVLIAVTKASGTATPQAHIFKGGSWTHEAMSSTLGNPATQAGGDIHIGANAVLGGGDPDFGIAVAAEWNSALAQGDIETLDDNSASQDWADLNPVAGWNLNQTDVVTDLTDWTGNGANETAITGTRINTYGPAAWNYNIATPANLPLQAASATFSATLALTAPALLPLQAANVVSSATLALTAPTQIPLAAGSLVFTDSLTLSAPTQVPLDAASLQFSNSLIVTVPGAADLGDLTASLTFTNSAAVSALTEIALDAASLLFSDSLALSAATRIPLDAASSTFSDSLALTAPSLLALGPASMAFTDSLALTAAARPPLNASDLVFTNSLVLSALTQVPLGASALTFSTSLALRAQTQVPLSASALQFLTSLDLTTGAAEPVAEATQHVGEQERFEPLWQPDVNTIP